MGDFVTWVLQANLLRRSKDDLAVCLKNLNIPFVGANVIPFSETLSFLSELPAHKRLIPCGSTSLLRYAQKARWQGVFFDANTFRVDTWLSQHPDMLNRATVLTVAQAAERWQETSGFWHLRPVEDLKLFSGVVLSANELKNWLKNPDSIQSRTGHIPPDTQIAISSAKELLAEWRWFIVNGQVVDGSLYRLGDKRLRRHEQGEEITRQAQKLADRWLPHEVCVMDTALVATGLKVTEFNCFNCSGFYDHDAELVLKQVTAYVTNKACGN